MANGNADSNASFVNVDQHIGEYYVHIVESPSAEDLLDGRTEGRALSSVLELAAIPHTYHLAVDFERFKRSLSDSVLENLTRLNRFPIIHLSAHGRVDQIGRCIGLALTDGSNVLWPTLDALLAPIHNATQGTTCVCLSACKAAHGWEMATLRENESPLDFLVGTTEPLTWSESAVAFIAFYHRLFGGAPSNVAVEAMKAASGHQSFGLYRGKQARLMQRIFRAQSALERITNRPGLNG